MASLLESSDLTERSATRIESINAAEAASLMRRATDTGKNIHVRVGDESIELSPAVAQTLTRALAHITSENMIKTVPVAKMLTTQQGAGLLNVSRPHVVKLLEAGEIPFEMTGKHRRVHLADILDFRLQRRSTQNGLLNELANLGQEFDKA